MSASPDQDLQPLHEYETDDDTIGTWLRQSLFPEDSPLISQVENTSFTRLAHPELLGQGHRDRRVMEVSFTPSSTANVNEVIPTLSEKFHYPDVAGNLVSRDGNSPE